jgi:hypothetical protein
LNGVDFRPCRPWHGHIYLNGADFDFAGGGAPRPGWIKLITPDGELRQVAGTVHQVAESQLPLPMAKLRVAVCRPM